MKYLMVIGDGMADAALEELGGKTPLEALSLPAFDRVAGGETGLALTVPHGMPAGSDTAILSIFGHDPKMCYSGRSALEAAGMGIALPDGCVGMRVNLCSAADERGVLTLKSHNGGGVRGDEARRLMESLVMDAAFSRALKAARLSITITDTFRHIGVMETDARELQSVALIEPHNVLGQAVQKNLPRVMPGCADEAAAMLACDIRALMLASFEALKDHPINKAREARGLPSANIIWPWGLATPMRLESFEDKYHRRGSVISAVPLVWGIAELSGLKTPRVPGATGELDTDYAGKAEAALSALLKRGDDFAAVHIEAPDEMAHAGELEKKLEAIRRIDALIVSPLLSGMEKSGEDFRLLLMSDHPTLMTTRTHDGAPVPYAIYDSRIPGEPRKLCERAVSGADVVPGTSLMDRLFQ